MSTNLLSVNTRAELIYLLSEAAELEHSLAAQYLFTAFTLKQSGDPGLTPAQAELLEQWSHLIYKIAIQEMLHLSLACNLLTAVGGAPNLRRPNFPQLDKYYSLGIASLLARFSDQTISRYMCWEKPETAGWWDKFCAGRQPDDLAALPGLMSAPEDLNPENPKYRTIGELYGLIKQGFGSVSLIGPPEAQITNTYLPFVPPLIAIKTADDAFSAIDLIVEEGEGNPKDAAGALAQSHFGYFTQIHYALQAELAKDPQFDPAWPVIDNPMYDFHHDAATPGVNIVTDPLTRQVGEVFTATYDLMLQILMRLFGNNGETEDQLKILATTSMELMTTAIKPLGVLLTRMPAGPEYPGKTAGPSFELYLSTQPLPHLPSAWTYFRERLEEIADVCQNLSQNPALPQRLRWVGMALQSMVARFAL